MKGRIQPIEYFRLVSLLLCFSTTIGLSQIDNGVPASEADDWSEVWNPTTGSHWRTKFDWQTFKTLSYDPFISEIWRNPANGYKAEVIAREGPQSWAEAENKEALDGGTGFLTKTIPGEGPTPATGSTSEVDQSDLVLPTAEELEEIAKSDPTRRPTSTRAPSTPTKDVKGASRPSNRPASTPTQPPPSTDPGVEGCWKFVDEFSNITIFSFHGNRFRAADHIGGSVYYRNCVWRQHWDGSPGHIYADDPELHEFWYRDGVLSYEYPGRGRFPCTRVRCEDE